jgi:hypothetical protein
MADALGILAIHLYFAGAFTAVISTHCAGCSLIPLICSLADSLLDSTLVGDVYASVTRLVLRSGSYGCYLRHQGGVLAQSIGLVSSFLLAML